MTTRELIDRLLAAQAEGRRLVETALIETRGSTPQKAGARMLVYSDGSQAGTLGGGCVEAEIKRAALECLQAASPRVMSFVLDHDYGWDDGLICGGKMTALLQPVTADLRDYYLQLRRQLESGAGMTEAFSLRDGPSPGRVVFDAAGKALASTGEPETAEALAAVRDVNSRPGPYVAGGFGYLPDLPVCRLFIIGAGHVGKALARYARDVEFDVTVVDDRVEYCNRENIPEASRHLVGRFDEVLPALNVDAHSFCVIVTRGHNHDEEALLHLVRKSPRYLGMIGSKRKIRLIFDDLLQQGIGEDQLSRVRAPIGVDIGSRTVEEIAISIAAELIACRNC